MSRAQGQFPLFLSGLLFSEDQGWVSPSKYIGLKVRRANGGSLSARITDVEDLCVNQMFFFNEIFSVLMAERKRFVV